MDEEPRLAASGTCVLWAENERPELFDEPYAGLGLNMWLNDAIIRVDPSSWLTKEINNGDMEGHQRLRRTIRGK